ncbi:hypothetical protein EDM52_06915 [Brevibacillus invocatus]|uniref:Uncharacterized protein n=1 Tax=Brevibacillus invocatus TaxID=173959 RepID=A0A3M8CHW1_9BACL|nr:tetratricopeptide repeat protein [Brevibacillus invocatus]RNB75312.1 hypothetical protein EDM52_06915 [Brevibacillus invocatus]
MKIEDWFHGLRGKAEKIEEKWPQATEQERLVMADQLFYLRQVSDRVVDLWLQFEEKLSQTIRQVKQMEGQVPDTEDQSDSAASAIHTLKKEMKKDEEKNDAPLDMKEQPLDFEHLFRRGEGFYHLRMFTDAKACFAELVAAAPDWETGRLYYAYSLLFCEEREFALREFRFLCKVASSPTIVAISYNAVGCMLAEEQQWLEAAQAFKVALETKPDQEDARFNLALCYYMDKDAQESVEEISKYLQEHEHDWEAQMLWLRAAHQLQGMDEAAELEPPGLLQLPTRELESETLKEMADLYEAVGNYHRAQICYRFLTERLPKEGWTWHGLAWNTWLIAGTRRAATLMKKAISLAPDQTDFLFSYGWMCLFDGEIDNSMNAFRKVLEKDSSNRLAQSGMIAAYEKSGEIQAAKQLAKTFLEDEVPFLHALGCFHLGRLSMIEENWILAEQYFSRAAPFGDQLREIPIYLQLCASKQGKTIAVDELLKT